MSDWYHLEKNLKGDTSNVVFHIEMPTGNNFAGFTWFRAVQEFRISGEFRETGVIVSRVPWLATDDIPQNQKVVDGEIWEQRTSVQYSKNLSKSLIAQAIDDKFDEISADILAQVEQTLDFWGGERAVV